MESSELTQKLNQIQSEDSSSQTSRILLLIYDAIENFEYKYFKIAGCLYVIIISIVLTFTLTMRDKHFCSLPYLEMIFVPILLMFCANFKMISQSNILPYITDGDLNWKAKHASLSLILSIVLLIYSFQQNDKFVSVFFFMSVWPLNQLYEKFRYKKEFNKELFIPFCCVFIGASFSTGTIQIITTQIELLNWNGILYSILGGILFCYSSDCFKKIDCENLFTLTHVIGLIAVIFIPLFFPIEGLQQPGIQEWLLFLIIGSLFLIGLPVIIRTLIIESTSILLIQLCWCFPFYILFKFIFGLQIPSFGQLCGVGIQTISLLFIIRYLNKQEGRIQKSLRKTQNNKIVELQQLS